MAPSRPPPARSSTKLDTYTEYSPSGDGLRLFLDGTLEHLVGRKRGPHECYNRARFLSITGQVVDGSARPIAARQAALDAWHLDVFGPPPRKRAPLPPTPTTRLDDQEILAKARTAKNGDRFAALFDTVPPAGDPRASEDDLALGDLLAFYAPEPAQLRRLLEASARRRAKWDERRGPSTWLDVYVIDKALASLTTTYSGGATRDAPSFAPTPYTAIDMTGHNGRSPASADGDAALLAENARLRAALAQAEALTSNLLRLLTNPHLRSEARLIVAEAMNYAKALRRGTVDEQGLEPAVHRHQGRGRPRRGSTDEPADD